jgi:hypothetical protein
MVSSAQNNDCTATLKNAVDNYDKGLYDKVIALLADKIDNCKFSKIELEQALKILASAYYDLDELEEGNKYMTKFLKKTPNYNINVNQDPAPFIDAYDKFLVRPKFSFSFGLGLNLTYPQVQKSFSIWEAGTYTNEYETISGTNFYLGVQWNFAKNFSLNTEINLLAQSYVRNITSPVFSNFMVKFDETFSAAMLPVYLKYSLMPHKKFFPEAYVGVLVYQPVAPTAKINAFDNADLDDAPREIDSEPSVDLTAFRNSDGNSGIMFGGRLNYRKNSLNVFFDWRYVKVNGDYVNSEKRYQNTELINDYYYIDDDIKLRYSSFTLGLTYNFTYKVKYKY